MAPASKRGPLFWVILGIVLLLAILGVVFTGIGYFTTQEKMPTVSTADPDYAALKMLTNANQSQEIIREEPEKLQILVRDKTSKEYFLVQVDKANNQIKRVPVPADQVK